MKQKRYILTILFSVLFILPGLAQNAHHYNELGNQAMKMADFDQAVEYYSQAIRRNPYSGVYFRNRAHAYFTKGDYHRASNDYSKAIRYYRNDPGVVARLYYQRGLCGYILSDYPGALQDFTSAIAMRPNVSDPYYFRGKVQKMVYSRDKLAAKDFRRVLELGPQYSIQTAFANYFMGNRYEGEAILNRLIRDTDTRSAEYANLNYNMAGLQAISGNEEKTMYYLDVALKSGFTEYEWLKRDMNFDKLRYSRAFRDLLNRLEGYQNDRVVTQQYPRYPDNNNNNNNYPNNNNNSPSAPADLQIEGLAFTDTDGNNRIDAREATYITFFVSNKGRGVASGMELEMSEINGVNGLGYTQNRSLGSLQPGDRKEIRVQVNGGTDLMTDQAEFKIQVKEQNGFDSRSVRISVSTQSFLQPQLTVVDYHFTTPNGGKMQLGIPVNLKMAIQNRGQGTANDVKVQMNVPTNVFTAGDASFSLGTLQPGESKIIDYEFFTNRRYEKSDVPIYAEITESYGQYGNTKVMNVAVNQQLEADSRVVIQAGPLAEVNINDIQLRSDVDKNLPRTFANNPDAVAVIIGNRDYVNDDVPPVDFALQDALSMKRYLMEVFGYDENNIIMLLNATQADFNGTFGTLESEKARLYNLVKADKSDVFVYYSGHGAPDIQENAGYFVPVDCDPSLVKFNGYSMNTFYQNLSKLPYRSLTVVIDACFSGSSDKGTLLAQTSLARIKSETGKLNDPNAVILTAATGDQVASWYPDQYHSLFTYYFLKAVQGAANTDRSNALTLGELRNYLNEEVPYMARRLRNRIQTPEINGKDGKIIVQY
jgi:hypothetical protein